jgi:chromosome partitioning protein
MELPRTIQTGSSRVIVVANEKGGSGKSTLAVHLAVALMKAGEQVATIDLDSRQKSLTRYIENRRTWAAYIGHSLEIPNHFCLGEDSGQAAPEDENSGYDALADAVEELAKSHSVLIIDSPGYKNALTTVVHSLADTLITPLNDSFVDLDVLGIVDPVTFQIARASHYAFMVEEARHQRSLVTPAPTDWIVLRNRVSMLASRNKRLVGEGLEELSRRLNFRHIDGLSERVIFREFYPRGLTALDDVNEAILGTRPTMSHVSARQEVQAVLDAIGLSELSRDRNRAA